MNLKLNDKIALVTGSTAGIGLAVAESLAREGVEVVLNGRTLDRIKQAKEKILKKVPDAKLKGVAADFSRLDEINNLISKIPYLDILINNIGIFEPSTYDKISDEDWYRIFDINVMSGIRLSRHYLPKMIEQNWGRILFISSESGVQIPTEMMHYGMTKTAQIAVARGFAQATKGSDVTVNSIIPGSTWSEGAKNYFAKLASEQNKTVDEVSENYIKEMRPSCLIQRFASTKEVADMVCFLCSPLAAATNGAAVRVDGGTVPTIL